MRLLSFGVRAPLLCSVLLGLTACSDDVDLEPRPRPELPYGTLEVSWSIDGRTDAEACEEAEAVIFRTALFDQGYFVGDIEVPCEDFSATRELYVDDYLARSTLLDADGFAVVRRVVEDFFDVAEDQVTRLSMDFPSSAALPMEPGGEADGGVPPADADDEPPPGEIPPDAGPPAEVDAAAPDAGI